MIARKWRPQDFQNLVGQNHIAQTLTNALRSGRVPHALLFTGPRGTGKTSSARIFAKSLRCPQAEDFVPCQKCSDCLDIAQGRHMDVIEIDGASNNGVDAIRELRDSVSYSPSSGTYKIYIIDEVHMLSSSAFNALLKTLEEPPPHVIFILATTEVQKIPNTILSRCQRFDFRMISQKEISQHLARICKQEGVSFVEEALWLIARQAKGSMRDSQSLLDQIITFSESNITVEKVTESLGLVQRELVNQALAAIVEKQREKLTPVIARLHTSGCDSSLFIEELLEQLRNSLMIKIQAHKQNVPLDLPDSEIQFLSQLVQKLSEEDIHLLFDITLKGSLHLSLATEPRLALEVLLLKLFSAPQIVQLSQLLSGDVSSQQKPKSPPTMAPQAQSVTSPAHIPAAPKEEVSMAAQLPKDPWLRFVENVRASNGLLAALLEHTYIVEQTPEVLKIGLPQKMSFLLDKVKDPKNLQKLQAFVESYWKQTPAISVELDKGVAEAGKPALTPKDKVNKADSEKREKERQMIDDHPLMKKTKSLFKTELVSIKEEKPS